MITKVLDRYKVLSNPVKASLWFLVCSFMQKGISTITTPIFTRLLTTSEYGNYNVFNSWLGVVTIFISLNLSFGVYTQGLVKFEDKRKEFSSSLQGLTLLLVLLWTLVYLCTKSFWNKLFSLSTLQMLIMLTMIWTTSVFNFWAAEKRVEYRYKALVFLTLFVSIAKPFIGIFLVTHAEDKVTARIFGLALVELMAYVWLFLAQTYRGRRLFSKKFWIYALSFNLPLIPHYLSQIILSSADRIMIKSIVDESSAGIYSLAYSISLLMTLFNNALSQTLSPWIYQKIKAKEIKSISNMAYISLCLVAFCNIVLIAFAPEAVAVFAPKTYREAIWVIPPVAMSVYFMFAYDLFAKFEFYYEKTKFISMVTAGGAALNVLLNYIFINKFGYIAAGYTTLICYTFYTVCHYFAMEKVCKDELNGVHPYNYKILLLITGAFFIIGFSFLFLYNHLFLRYVFLVGIFVIAFLKKELLKEIVKMLFQIRKCD